MLQACLVAQIRRSLLGIISVIIVTTEVSGQGARREREYPYAFEIVWEATTIVLQEQGNTVVQSDAASGLISTDNRWQDADELRYRYNLRVSRVSESVTSVSASCAVEGEGAFGLWWSSEKSDSSREALVLEGIAQRLDPNSAAPNIPSPICMESLRIGGSIVRGSSYSTMENFNRVTPEAVIAALRATLVKEGFSIREGADTMPLVAVGKIGNREGQEATFTADAASGSVRLSVRHRLPIGTRGRDDLVREQLCTIFGGVGRLTRAPLRVTAMRLADNNRAPISIEERLKKLEELYKKGLITREEYEKKRAELLQQL
jgi:hypothetical protein